jgi:anti-sigma factor RsiW
MNCEKCQELLSEFIDGELENQTSAEIKTHLSLCAECAEIHEDFAGILGFCDETYEESLPPNAQALWCRINNVIEAEVKPEIAKEVAQKDAKQSWLTRMWNRHWSLSFTQLTSAVLGIALVSSLLTIVGIKNALNRGEQQTTAASMQPSLFDAALSKIGLVKSPQEEKMVRRREQQQTIEYWNTRVGNRRNQWDKNLREAFDRNMREIDQVMVEYSQNLEKNPQDDLSGEMLDSAMHEKMQLLREFSEL